MELSPQLQQQAPQEQPHILHPDLEETAQPEPPVYMMDPSLPGGKLRTFDYDAALQMIDSSPKTSSTSPLEQPKTPEREPIFYPRTNVLRPGDDVRKSNADRIKAALAVGAFSLAGAFSVEAKDINTRPYERAASTALKNVLLGAVVPDAAIVRDAQGNEVMVRKTPQELAINMEVKASPQVKEYAKAIGVGILNSANILTVLNEGNPGQCVTIPKYTSETQYVTNLRLTAAEGGGLLLYVDYVQGVSGNRLIPKSQIVTIKTDANHNMACTIIGG